jgi:hypothetical protein
LNKAQKEASWFHEDCKRNGAVDAARDFIEASPDYV